MIDQLRTGNVPDHALLGVATQSADAGTGATVVTVDPKSGAAAGGLHVGDVITSVDDTPIDGPESLAAVVAEHQPDEHVSVTIERDGSTQTLDVTLGTRATITN